tara:strand:+ start:829 stop:4248 length:3420 start_codon:yes stop_codon:yes gene_type:complete
MITEKYNEQNLYQIKDFDKIESFLMTLTSSDDYWMYISSSGCLTAGKKNAETCLFPYETVNNIHNNAHITGPITIIKVKDEKNKTILWEPFNKLNQEKNIERSLYKNCIGNTIIFEENNISLKLKFRYQWNISKEFGFVKQASIINYGKLKYNLSVIDGLQNIMASGIELQTQQSMSNLSNAYRYSEVLEESKCALYSLTSLLMDTPKPGESLFANVVWSVADFKHKVSLSSEEISRFKNNLNFNEDYLITGKPGSYLINFDESIESNNKITWKIISDVKKTQTEIADLDHKIRHENNFKQKIVEGIHSDSFNLERYIGNADGFQCTQITINDMHHTANVLYNVMRGGILFNSYKVNRNDFINFIKIRNINLYNTYKDEFKNINDNNSILDLIKLAEIINNPSFIRLCYSYLPITFGRRHGDPSRPWNQFEIIVKDEADKQRLYYEGNWRDIFQNWEALSISYPLTLESMLSNFINNTTADGFNPFRVTSEGIDWDVPDPDDSWSGIGYWNDHQIIYLLKFLEKITDINQNLLLKSLSKNIFSYANVPYEIKNINELINDPKQTINFNFEKNENINHLVKKYGTDAKYIMNGDNEVYHVNLCEKLLVIILAKISNFIPGGGIWLNTQRPEWNDANNALVGYGISMVTTYYLRRFLIYFKSLISESEKTNFIISKEVLDWFNGTHQALHKYQLILNNKFINPKERIDIVKDIGTIFSEYRDQLYNYGFSDSGTIEKKEIIDFLNLSIQYFDHTISLNIDNNQLYNSYNILKFSQNNTHLDVNYLYEMLEGQVAVLSSGYLSTKDSIKLLKNLYSSEIYRQDQNSFMLYPIKKINSFMSKNIINENLVYENKLLCEMLETNTYNIIQKDINNNYRFNPNYINISDLKTALKKYNNQNNLKKLSDEEVNIILNMYENTFNHKSYTGRSSNMFAYEGIGSIYWHMVSKLLLAVQELFFKSVKLNEDKETIQSIGEYYYKVRSGLSADKTPQEYGAFPFDAYSHTPFNSGAKQPGMTGQVKEEIITRIGELGCFVEDGSITFKTELLRLSEFLNNEKEFTYFNILNEKLVKTIKKGELCYTYCQIPVTYRLVNSNQNIKIIQKDKKIVKLTGNKLSKVVSNSIFQRDDSIKEIYVDIPNQSMIF